MKCKHEDLVFDYEWDGDPEPIGFWAECVECGHVLNEDSFTAEEQQQIVQDAAMMRMSDLIDSAVDHQREVDAGLI